MLALAATPSRSAQGLPASKRERSSTQKGSAGSRGCFPFPLPSCRRTRLFLSGCWAILSSTSQWAGFPHTRPGFHILVFPNTLGRLQITASQQATTSLPRPNAGEWGPSPTGVQTPSVRARAGLVYTDWTRPRPRARHRPAGHVSPPSTAAHRQAGAQHDHVVFLIHGGERSALRGSKATVEKGVRSPAALGPGGKGKKRGEEKRS